MPVARFTFDAGKHRKNSLAAWLPDLLGRAAQSIREAASRRANGAGLDGEGVERAILYLPPDQRSPITRYFSQDTPAGQPKNAGSDRAARGEPGASPLITAQHENE
ncbi:MAG: hypothetical protein WAM17_03330, partial [Rhodoplanes sp.]